MRSMEPTPGRTRPENEWKTIRSLLPYLWPAGELGLRVRVVIAMIFLVAAKGTNVAVPIFYKEAVDSLTIEKGVELALTVPIALLIGYGIARVMAQAFGELRDAVFTKVAQRAIRLAGLKTFRHLHQLSLRFHLERKTGGISRAVERGTKGIEFLLRFMLFNILPTLLEIALICGVLWYLYGPTYALLTLATLTVYILWTTLITEWRLKFRRTMNEMDGEATTKAIDSLLNFETVKYFGNEDHEANRFDRALQTYEQAAVRSGTSLALLNIGQGVIIACGVSGAMIMAGYGVVNGSMTIGDFVLVNSYLIQIFMPLNFLGFVYREIKRSLIDMEAMFELLQENPDIADNENAKPLERGPGAVRFENVAFAYDPRREILKSISFDIPAGTKLAIVGPSGAGKSTISRLLYRFYDATSGSISIDGQDTRLVTQKSLRAAIGIVPQDTVLFNDTVYYNIAYGDPTASPAEVEEAAKLAKIHDFIMSLPDGYQSKVGERGLKLSGGEKQRVAIARTILKNPCILVFDEATSALDSRTEQDILASFKDVSRDRTTLTIAHRLSTVIDADEILVLQAGDVVERGTHADLLTMNGVYADMWARQQEAKEAAEKLSDLGEPMIPSKA